MVQEDHPGLVLDSVIVRHPDLCSWALRSRNISLGKIPFNSLRLECSLHSVLIPFNSHTTLRSRNIFLCKIPLNSLRLENAIYTHSFQFTHHEVSFKELPQLLRSRKKMFYIYRPHPLFSAFIFFINSSLTGLNMQES